MKTQLSVLALSAILIVSLSVAPVHGQMSTIISAPITVTSDMSSYEEGDKILVSGMVSRPVGGDVSIQIIGPNESMNRVAIQQASVNADNTFSAEFTAGGLMNMDGTYMIMAQYGVINVVEAMTTFEYMTVDVVPPVEPIDPDPVGPEPDVNIGEDTVTMEGTDDVIQYEMTSGRLLSVMPNLDSTSLVLTIEAPEDGTLTLTIPKTILDAKIDGMDDDLFILIDNSEEEFDEEKSDVDRTLTIEYLAGAEMIEIFGTFVVPEFGVIAVMILAVALVSIIAVSSRSRLGMIPRL